MRSVIDPTPFAEAEKQGSLYETMGYPAKDRQGYKEQLAVWDGGFIVSA